MTAPRENGWEELRRLALEADGDGWHNAPFLRAFIDPDDETVFSPEDARFIEAASPSVVLRLLAAARGEPGLDVERLARAIAGNWPDSFSPQGYGDPKWQRALAEALAERYDRLGSE